MKRSNSCRAPLVEWVVAGTIVLVGAGCAHQSKDARSAQEKKIQSLESRIDELERTNGRLVTRLDEMEDDVFLLEDRVEAHRLALKRRKKMGKPTSPDRQRGQAIRAPEPTPETNYGNRRYRRQEYGRRQRRGTRRREPARGQRIRTNGNENGQADQPDAQRPSQNARRPDTNDEAGDQAQRARRPDTSSDTNGTDESTNQAESRNPESSGGESARNQGSEGDGDPIVITNEDFEKFAKEIENRDGGGRSSNQGANRKKRPKKRVTDEKLATSEELRRKRKQKKRARQRDNEKKESARRARGPEDSPSELNGKSGLDLYKTSLAKYRAGDYDTALSGFKSFLEDGPRKDYRDNGLYWVGECYFGLGDHKRAIAHFQRVLDEQPDGNKVPDAMLKMALAYRELDDTERARKLLDKLTRRYPGTNAARLADKKLSDLES